MNVSAKIGGNGGSAAFRKSNSIAVASPHQLNSNNIHQSCSAMAGAGTTAGSCGAAPSTSDAPPTATIADVSVSIQEAIKAARSLLHQSEMLKNRIFKNQKTTKTATPTITIFPAALSADGGGGSSSVHDSSQKNVFSEYRNVLKSQNSYSEDFGTNSSLSSSLSLSNATRTMKNINNTMMDKTFDVQKLLKNDGKTPDRKVVEEQTLDEFYKNFGSTGLQST